MSRIVLLSCVKKKLPYRAKAQDLYCSPLFKMSLKYAWKLRPDRIFILSAKYGLVDPDQKLDPYNETLNYMAVTEVRKWSEKVVSELGQKADLADDEFIILAGKNYYKYILPYISNYSLPLEGLTMGKRLRFLKGS